ncbi:hypothetical protein GCM10011360_17510 [Primorskyibacter flagellatus]|uniref:Uncharacterized protein n=1 Tax=Primorskyibacter flagellatus TaxID=1387277 RepID=A0A917EE12_9RHOB|nr:hypothetical protein [Primorskyibacter flagellatus]GGE29944.1 hypothetical protein GCM10011360_17510 [Primorskyibacter flagellatus]
MATLTQSTQDMVDAYKQLDGYGRYIDTIETMNDTSQDILDDWSWMECNSGQKHTRSIRTGLPTVAWGALYEGIPQSKSSKQTVDDTTGFVESLADVDKRQIKLYAENATAFRQAEARTHIESMSQELMRALFYYDPATNARHPKGLGARFSKKATSGAGAQIVDAGGTGSDNTSIYMVEWSYDGLSVIYPKGTVGGIQRENKGEQRVLDANGNPYFVEEEMFSAQCGFTLGDWQRCAAIRNIDASELAAGNVDIYAYMRKAYWKLKSRRVRKVANQSSPGRIAIYCNRDVLEALDALGTNSGANDNFTRLRLMEIQGKEVETYRGFPLRETDAILNTEARVV